jgi:hypothetical protein
MIMTQGPASINAMKMYVNTEIAPATRFYCSGQDHPRIHKMPDLSSVELV